MQTIQALNEHSPRKKLLVVAYVQLQTSSIHWFLQRSLVQLHSDPDVSWKPGKTEKLQTGYRNFHHTFIYRCGSDVILGLSNLCLDSHDQCKLITVTFSATVTR